MILNLERFPIFILYMLMLLPFFSCNKKQFRDNATSYENSIQKAMYHNTNQQFDSAFYYFNKAKLACDESETEKKNYCLHFIAEIEQRESDFSGSEVTAIEALENNSQSIYLPNIYNQLGIAYAAQNDFENAIKYYNKAYQVTEDKLYKAILKNNIAVVYLEDKKYQNALTTLEPLLQDDTLQKYPTEYAKIVDNLGFTYAKTNDPRGITFLNKALKIRVDQKINYELIASYLHLSEFYEKKDIKKAQYFAELEYAVASKTNSVDDRISALKFLVKNTFGATSRKYAIKQIYLSDSINKVRQKTKTQFAKIKYDATKAIKETENQKKEKQFYILLFLFTAMTGLFSYFLIRSRNKRKLANETYTTETRISKKLHDELANKVFHSLTFAQTQDWQDAEKKETFVTGLDQIYDQIRDFSRTNETIDTGQKFENNLVGMLSDFNSHSVRVIIKKDAVDWQKIKPAKKIALHRVLLELLVNMKKHSQCSFVIIKIESTDKNILIDYTDNGIGDKNQMFLKKGLPNTENRIKAINGTVTFDPDNDKGFKIKISFPK
jgi:signal transduction histidine kinase